VFGFFDAPKQCVDGSSPELVFQDRPGRPQPHLGLPILQERLQGLRGEHPQGGESPDRLPHQVRSRRIYLRAEDGVLQTPVNGTLGTLGMGSRTGHAAPGS
jgi:hypothetical protein